MVILKLLLNFNYYFAFVAANSNKNLSYLSSSHAPPPHTLWLSFQPADEIIPTSRYAGIETCGGVSVLIIQLQIIFPHFVYLIMSKKYKFSDNSKLYYFNNVPELAWNFYIGGYQPAQKWLKDRKGRQLSFEDILHYQKIIVALTKTDKLMKEIDEVGVE